MRFYYFYTLVKTEFIKLFKIEIKQHNTVIHLQSDLFCFWFLYDHQRNIGLFSLYTSVSELPAIYFNVIYLIVFFVNFYRKKNFRGQLMSTVWPTLKWKNISIV